MKSKAKLSKVNECAKPNNWMLMAKEEITVADIKALFEENPAPVEIWEDAGILEIPVEEKISIDVETVGNQLKDEFSREFMAKNGVKAVFYISFPRDAYEACESALKKMKAGLDCIIVADSEDFKPEF